MTWLKGVMWHIQLINCFKTIISIHSCTQLSAVPKTCSHHKGRELLQVHLEWALFKLSGWLQLFHCSVLPFFNVKRADALFQLHRQQILTTSRRYASLGGSPLFSSCRKRLRPMNEEMIVKRVKWTAEKLRLIFQRRLIFPSRPAS